MPLLRFERLDSDVLLRAVGICMVVYHHVVLYNGSPVETALFGASAVGGMGMLLLLSGFSFARFGLHNRGRTEAKAAVISTARSIILPCYLAIIFFSIVARTFNPYEFLMVGNFVRDNWQAGFNTWYPQFLLQVFLLIFLLYHIKPIGDWLVRRPVVGSVVLLALSLAIFLVMRESPIGWLRRPHLPWMLMWNFFLGWALFNLTKKDNDLRRKRILASVVCVAAVALTLHFSQTRSWVTCGGGLLLIWLPSFRFPKPVTRLAMILSQAALTIFILHMSVIKIFGFAFGRPNPFHLLEAGLVVLAVSGLWLVCASMSRAFTYLRLRQKEGGDLLPRHRDAEAQLVLSSVPARSG